MTTEIRRLFLIEDDVALAKILALHLRSAGFDVTVFHRGDTGLEALVGTPPDLAILDVMLPGMDGLEVLREVRRSSDLPVLMVSARGTELDRILGLELGGDDYLTKPLSGIELVARVKALFRRLDRQTEARPSSSDNLLEVGDLTIDLDQNVVRKNEACHELTLSEFSLLTRLMRVPGKTFSREELSSCLENENAHDSRAVDVHIGNIRRKLLEIGVHSSPIRSVRGVGYRFRH